MVHDVFISYSSKDKNIADVVYATLESNSIHCWIAPQDILPGVDWGEAIVEAVGESRVVVLIFSSNANYSNQVKREVERAVSKGIAIISFRVENVIPTGSLEYYLSTQQWLDAFTPPLETYLQRLTTSLKILLESENSTSESPQQTRKQFFLNDVELNVKFAEIWMLVDANVTFLFDGQVIATGSLTKGATFTIRTTTGKHILKAQHFWKEKQYEFDLPLSGKYEMLLTFNRGWGEFNDDFKLTQL